MKTILVPTDFSEHALQATKAAAQLARSTKASIVLLHNVYTEVNWSTLPPSKKLTYPEIIKKSDAAMQKLDKIIQQNIFDRIKVSYMITYGVAYEEITLKAKKLKAELIIMGSHGNEKSDRYFIGSTVQKVLRESTTPVLLIKKGNNIKKWNQVAIGADFDLDITKTFNKVKGFLKELKCSPSLLYVNRPADFMDTRTINSLMDNFIKKYPGIKFNKAIYNHTQVEDGILEFAEDNKMDWIILLTRSRVGKPRYLIGNTEALAFHSTVPVLSVNILPVPLK